MALLLSLGTIKISVSEWRWWVDGSYIALSCLLACPSQLSSIPIYLSIYPYLPVSVAASALKLFFFSKNKYFGSISSCWLKYKTLKYDHHLKYRKCNHHNHHHQWMNECGCIRVLVVEPYLHTSYNKTIRTYMVCGVQVSHITKAKETRLIIHWRRVDTLVTKTQIRSSSKWLRHHLLLPTWYKYAFEKKRHGTPTRDRSITHRQQWS